MSDFFENISHCTISSQPPLQEWMYDCVPHSLDQDMLNLPTYHSPTTPNDSNTKFNQMHMNSLHNLNTSHCDELFNSPWSTAINYLGYPISYDTTYSDPSTFCSMPLPISPSIPEIWSPSLSVACSDHTTFISEPFTGSDPASSPLDVYDFVPYLDTCSVYQSPFSFNTTHYENVPLLAESLSIDTTTPNILTPHPKPALSMMHENPAPKTIKDRSFVCVECHRGFTRRHDLERHKRVHSGAQPYGCPNCHRQFARTDARTRHWRIDQECGRSVKVLSIAISKRKRSSK